MTDDLYAEGYDAGHRAARQELTPLADAILDALLMFKDIEKARQLPATAHAVQQYVSMGRQLERLLALSKLRGTPETLDIKPMTRIN
jgi:hypothetical protein